MIRNAPTLQPLALASKLCEIADREMGQSVIMGVPSLSWEVVSCSCREEIEESVFDKY